VPAGEVPRPEVCEGLFSEVERFQQVEGWSEDLDVVDLLNFVEHFRPEMQRGSPSCRGSPGRRQRRGSEGEPTLTIARQQAVRSCRTTTTPGAPEERASVVAAGLCYDPHQSNIAALICPELFGKFVGMPPDRAV